MKTRIGSITEKVLDKVIPKEKERRRILRLAESVKKRVEEEAERQHLDAEVKIEGSIAKDTWLSGEADIDIFMLVPTTTSREELETTCLNIGREAVRGWPTIERFAEHPYIESQMGKVRINIVPCYRVSRGKWISAADRTPFHTDYVKNNLQKEKSRGEVRLLKRFMKGVGVYGAEIKVGGFSGYLCELLILNYDGFLKTLESATKWEIGQVIDIENYYGKRLEEVRTLFDAPLIIIDPVDKNRNAAAAVIRDRFYEFIAASKAFLKNPCIEFFYPKKTRPLTTAGLIRTLKHRGTDLVFVRFGGVNVAPDILWGQLYKTLRSLAGMLKRYDFNVIRTSVWSDEKNINIFVFELESEAISPTKKHIGPPVKRREAEDFLKKYLRADHTISGPWIENGRWMVEVKRKIVKASDLFREKLKDGGRRVGVGNKLAEIISKTLEILVNEEIVDFYHSNTEFKRFLTSYLKGKPRWL